MPESRTDWSSTVRLPKTAFPQKGDLAKREPEFLAAWQGEDLYGQLRARQKGRPPFVLHDGPPYANGNIHIGHALNKVLKDMTVKARALMGHETPYVPGWDCHGLPIETALLKEKKMSKRGVTDVPAFRAEAAAFAERFIALQREEFKRLGVFGEWDKPYKTLEKGYEAAILKAFAEALKKGLIYRGLKPVLWCPTCETALAEAEVEYKDKTSPSVYVALPIVNGDGALKDASLVVWTTTPWTLPANRAVAVHPSMEYVVVEAGGKKLVVGKARLEAVLKEAGLGEAKTVATLKGSELKGTRYKPPYGKTPDEACPVVLADYVTAEDGAGLVHTAPGHGEDDFHTGQREKLEILNPVDHAGFFTDKAPRWKGKHIFKEGNPEIVADLGERALLLAKKDINHSYPHCWRCKNPVVFRTTEQWFLGLNEALRKTLGQAIDATQWVPAAGRERISSMVQNRPDWCVSRQRVWGTPIAVLFSAKTGEAVTDAAVLDAIVKKAEQDGIGFWFERWGEPLKPSDWPWLPAHPALADGFRRETDILDVWLDSGVSWLSVLGEGAVADLYLEGSDQHRGWFQSSLVMSAALRGKAPYKAVLTHGFVLDEKGRAMHKSTGNVVAPQEMISEFGADVLRLWVALSDYNDDVRISKKLMEVPAEAYRRVRNTLRYLLGNLEDFTPAQAVPYEKLPELDRHLLLRLAQVQKETLEDFREYRYRAAARRLVDFCGLELSPLYLDCTKDRMYTFRAGAPQRRAAQSVQYEVLLRLCALLSPILTFTADEAWRQIPRRPAASVFLWDLPPADPRWTDAALAGRWEKLLALREAKLTLPGSAADFPGVDLHELLMVSELAFGGAEVSVSKASGAKCPRCWRWQSDIGADPAQPELCRRCASQL
jgi:isoleucyl-tRNA synthetase